MPVSKTAKAGAVLPAIPDKRYFTIGEVSELCLVKQHVLRYWEQEFPQLKPVKRRGNRRYYQPHEVQLIRRIRELLYDQGFTIEGARSLLSSGKARGLSIVPTLEEPTAVAAPAPSPLTSDLRAELEAIMTLLKGQA
jgi:DNA-binding transcriptional MerR regulator